MEAPAARLYNHIGASLLSLCRSEANALNVKFCTQCQYIV
jgi:hypothetical protein